MKQTENKINKAFNAITPDILDSVVRDSENTKGTVFYMKKQKRFPAFAIAVAAAFVLIFGAAVGIFTYLGNNAVSSVVSIDVNPSVEIKLNRNDKVVNITSLNEDGKKIIGDMDLIGVDIEVALNALVGSMITNGYITDMQNSILVSVENDNKIENASLREKLNSIISSLLKTENSDCAVITQKVETSDTETQRLADRLGVSLGKAQLIAKLCAHNSKYTPESLVSLGINELTLLVESLGAQIDGEVSGTASNKAYIGKDAATAAALEYLNLSEGTEIKKQKVSLDFDDGIMVYEVETVTEQYEYEVEVDAITGEIISCETDEIYSVNGTPGLENGFITPEKVSEIILSYCPEKSNWLEYECEFDHDDGVLVFEVELEYAGVEHNFIINAVNGEVITHKTDRYQGSEEVSIDGFITKETALDIVLERASLSKDDISRLNIELEKDDGVWKYEIEFRSGKYEYEAQVNADNGEIISYERDVDD